MTKTRNLSDLLDANGKVDNTDILNVDAAKITTGTLDAGRIDNNSLANVTALPFSAGTDWQSTIVTGTTLTAETGKGYWINTTSNACTVTLPGSASIGDTIQIVDYAGTFATNNITLTSSLDIEGSTDDKLLNTNREGVTITYVDATQGWVATSGVNSGNQAIDPLPITVDFLVVAGGGGGSGDGGAGGSGAGGYRNSYSTESSGGGGSSETSLGLFSGTTYTITVGAGGTACPVDTGLGGQGGDSSITGSDITDIISAGGGVGGGTGGGNNTGTVGGSGGGADGAASGAGASGTANQGFAGGAGTNGNAGGGGGGAGAVGANNSGGNPGNGGTGLDSSITGSAITRGGGGGGATYNGTQSSGGGGGGGDGGTQTPVRQGSSGTANTGGGAGGKYASAPHNAGGSGVVILRMLTADYSGTTTGSPTVSTSGSDTILIYNASGSYTA